MAKVMPTPKVALVYDWLDTQYGGAEKVLLALHQAFPDAPLYTSRTTGTAHWAATFKIHQSFLQKFPLFSSKPRYMLPLLPLAFESLDVSDYDLVLSVSSGFAKGIVTPADVQHVAYLLTPPRYLYSHEAEYVAQSSSWPLVRAGVKQMLKYLKWWDRVAAQRPDVIIPISNLIADRCWSYYQRQPAATVYPPVDALEKLEISQTEAHQLAQLPQKYALVVSRLVGYKRIDLAVLACQEKGLPLIIIGDGEERSRLEKLVTDQSLINFWGSQSQAVVNQAIRQATLVLMPGLEDFGITAAEAVATGTPVIVHRHSGVAELLQDGKTALFLDTLSVENLVKCLDKIAKTQFQPEFLQKTMRKYATTTFVQQMRDIVKHQLEQ